MVTLFSSATFAQDCPRPQVRTTNALVTAIAQDEVMANGFENAAAVCATEGQACDEAKVRCGQLLTTTLQQQLSFDEGAYLRDMLIAYAGQQYRMTVPIASVPPANDVSCNAEANSLKAAAQRRKQQAERRKQLTAEYPKWITWVNGQYKACTDRQGVDKVRSDKQAAEAAALLAAAEAARQVEQSKLDAKSAAEKAAREKAEAEAKVKADALKAQQAAADEAARQKAAAEQAQKDKAEEERRARETAEERAAREAQEAANAKAVADREAKKLAVEKQRQDLVAKEDAKGDAAKAKLLASRAAADAAHQKKIEELKRTIELSEADRASRMAELDAEYATAEAKRQEESQKVLDEAPVVDRSDERLNGALAIAVSGGYFSIAPDSKAMIGAHLSLRQGFWGTAPASGLASGVELRATAHFLLSTDAKTYFLQASPEIRYWFGFFALGAAFDYQRIQLSAGPATDTIGLGPTLSLAAFDSPDARLFFTVRWTPFLNEQYERVTGEIEGGYKLFGFAVQGGVVKQGRTTPLGFFVSVSLGIRVRW